MRKVLPLRAVIPLLLFFASAGINVLHSPSCLAAESSAATLSAPEPIYKEIEDLIKESYPKAKCERTGENFRCSFKSKVELGYYSRRPIAVPSAGGLWIEIQLKPGEYTETDKAFLPSEKNEGHHTTLTMAPYSKAMQAHLFLQMSYPSETSPEFKDRVKEIANSFVDYRPKKKKSSSAATTDEQPKSEEKSKEQESKPDDKPKEKIEEKSEETKPEKSQEPTTPSTSSKTRTENTSTTSSAKTETVTETTPETTSSATTSKILESGAEKTETVAATEAPVLSEKEQKMGIIRRLATGLYPEWELYPINSFATSGKDDKLKEIKANKKLTAAVKQQKTKAIEKLYEKKAARCKVILTERKVNFGEDCLEMCVTGMDAITDWSLEDYRDLEGFARLLNKTKAKYEKDLPGLFKSGKSSQDAYTTLGLQIMAKCKPLFDNFMYKLAPVVAQLDKEEAAGKFK